MANQLDPRIIGKLAEVLNKNNLSELEYEDEGCRICLKGAAAAVTVVPAAPAPLPPAPPAPPAAAPAQASAKTDEFAMSVSATRSKKATPSA